MRGEGYLGRAVRLVLQDPAWWKKSLLLVAVTLIPYVGIFIALGYYMVHVRNVAWDTVESLPSWSNRDAILKRGIDAFVISMVWGLVLLLPSGILTFGWVASLDLEHLAASGTMYPVPPWWFVPVIGFLGIIVNAFAYIALLRSSIYLSLNAGLSVSGVRQLIRRDTPGIVRVTGLMVAVAVIGLIPGTFAMLLPRLPGLAPYVAMPLSSAMYLLSAIVNTPLTLVLWSAYGLWARDTNPATWPPLSTTSASQPRRHVPGPSPAQPQPPGWLPDPTGRADARYWDGSGWTRFAHNYPAKADRGENGPT